MKCTPVFRTDLQGIGGEVLPSGSRSTGDRSVDSVGFHDLLRVVESHIWKDRKNVNAPCRTVLTAERSSTNNCQNDALRYPE